MRAMVGERSPSLSAAIFRERDLSAAEMHHATTGTAVVFSTRCPGKKTPNEDAAAIIPINDSSAILVVADGVGGQRSGGEAAGIVIDALLESLSVTEQLDGAIQESKQIHDDFALRAAILNGIEVANRRILDLGIGAASTLAVVEIQDQTVRPYHIGDSMIVVVGQRGRFKLQTVPHSPVGFALEAGVLNHDEAMYHADRHVVSNVVGTEGMRIEIGSPLQLSPRDTVLLASDGLFDNLHLDEIVERIRKGSLPKAITGLVADCQRRMQSESADTPSKPDDLTVVLFRLG